MPNAPTLTRRPDKDPSRSGGFFVYYGDVRVGHIGKQAGVPNHADQWGWTCGFQPGCHAGEHSNGTAASFEEARDAFQRAWHRLLPKKTEAHFEMWRRHRDFTAWKYRMWKEGLQMPTQRTDSRAKCFCGAEITTASIERHVNEAHRGIGAE